MLQFGKPTLAAIAHMDSIGFTARYQDQLVPVGSPEVGEEDELVGVDHLGPIRCRIEVRDGHLHHRFPRAIDRGTALSWTPYFNRSGEVVTATFLDNRVGVYTLLRIAEVITDGLLIFSTWEEHGGGSVPYLARYFFEELGIHRCLISDVTWQSDGITSGEGVVVSARDAHIPRRMYVQQIQRIAEEYDVRYQTEVEAAGSSDGREVQQSPYPVDWCFVGACIERMHSSRERVSLRDLQQMVKLYTLLFDKL